MRIANTGVDDQTSATRIEKKARLPSISQGMSPFRYPQRLQRVVDEPDIVVEQKLELEADEDRREHHRKHHKRAQHPLSAHRSLEQQREAEAEQHFEIERKRQKHDGAQERAHRNTRSVNSF